MNDSESSADREAQRSVENAVARFARAMGAFEAEAVVALCDEETHAFVYQAEELDGPIRSIERLRDYVVHAPRIIDSITEVSVLESAVEIHGDIAVAFYRSWARIRVAATHEVIDGQVRQSFVFRRRPGGWRLSHYHESRQAAEFRSLVGAW